MKKILIPIAAVLVVAAAIAAIVFVPKKSSVNPPVVASPVAANPVSLCFYGQSKTPSGLSDVSLAVLDIAGDRVTGSFKYLPAEKDSKAGSFSGTVGPVDRAAMARTADVVWNVSAEGTDAKEQLRIVFGEGTAQAGFGEMVRGADGVWNYKDASKLSYGQVMTDVACDDVRILQNADGRACYAYHQAGTKDEPAAVDEYLDIVSSNALVTGTKTGYPKGPDIWDTYTGTISGTRLNGTVRSEYSYVVEGSKGREEEIYEYVAGGIRKLRYPLSERKGVLVPDTAKPFVAAKYESVDCASVPKL